mgnify:CR=1 FL=1
MWWLIHAQHVGKRTAPLSVIGPPGPAERFVNAAEALFPASSNLPRRYELNFIELLGEAAARGRGHPRHGPLP